MNTEKLLTVRDTALLLGISEKEVMDLAEEGKIPAYKVGGLYLRFKREQVEEYLKGMNLSLPKVKEAKSYSFGERLSDFFYFNDFYILSILVILIMFFIIFQG